MFVAAGHRAAAVLDRADMILRHLFRLDRFPFRLDDLTDLFLDRHLRQHIGDALLDDGIKADGRFGDRPELRMNDGRFWGVFRVGTKGQQQSGHGRGGP